ncbi:N6-adenosine-methyltransferase subunit mettl3 [Chytridiales sp. JEL 0842]|nr:N6-adenosine-methyltransferase subunit mettl3 [Chytridiales sp. JEL 0842]
MLSKTICQVHFRPIVKPYTDFSLGDCSYLNTCHRIHESCKYVHYELEPSEGFKHDLEYPLPVPKSSAHLPAQWINCDIRKFDLKCLGIKFSVVMADPPWDIHMNLPYGTMTDDEMKQMALGDIQEDGFLFLWVTGRAMEVARDCLNLWGYKRVEELVWIKTNQLQKIIRTGRTGHWLNHGKEHCVIAVKGNPTFHNAGLDGDVLVAEVGVELIYARHFRPPLIYSL